MGDHYKDLSDTDRMLSCIEDRLEETNGRLDRIANGIDRLTVILGIMATRDLAIDSGDYKTAGQIIQAAQIHDKE